MQVLKNQTTEAGLCHVSGVNANGIHAGFKFMDKDLALLYIPNGATVAGVFTRNQVKAHSVIHDMKLLKQHSNFKAVLINSGNANACNGPQGLKDLQAMVCEIQKHLNIEAHEILVSSTGIIGEPLDLNGFYQSSQQLVDGLSSKDSQHAAEAIMTTDTKAKTLSRTVKIGDSYVHFGAMIKGAGMIHPNMGTMLAYITTDADLSQHELKTALTYATDHSFNTMTVDGDTSTNDTALLLSTNKVPIHATDHSDFTHQLTYLCQDLAKMVADDAEGSTKFVTVKVSNAYSDEDAVIAAKAVATSSLVKTALYGEDANWGRIITALGNSKAVINQDLVSIAFSSDKGNITVCQHGMASSFDESVASEVLAERDLSIFIDLNIGSSSGQVWTCDMSIDYIKINADYRS